MSEKKKKQKTKKSTYYAVSDAGLKRQRKNCPKCGAGVFLAEHNNRLFCGKCAYTEWKTGGK